MAELLASPAYLTMKILVTRPHDLTPLQALYLRREYADAVVSISADIAQWQAERYGADLTQTQFNRHARKDQLLEVITQMLWERQEYGFPWTHYQEEAQIMGAETA
jgi:hypothetical protein